jgi:hypothetical protein
MNRIAGISNSPVGSKVMNFHYMMCAKSPETGRMVSANLYGPAFWTIRTGTNLRVLFYEKMAIRFHLLVVRMMAFCVIPSLCMRH